MFPGNAYSSLLHRPRTDLCSVTVTGVEQITEYFHRLRFDDGGLLTGRLVHPTMSASLCFDGPTGPHRRSFTLVDPDPAAGTFAVEFAVHAGTASRWAQSAIPGDRLSAAITGPRFELPRPGADGWLIAGDATSLSAVNSLLEAIAVSDEPDVPVTIWMEYGRDDEFTLPLRIRDDHRVEWIPRGDPAALVDAIAAQAFAARGYRGWVGTEAHSAPLIADVLRRDYALGAGDVTAIGFWAHAGVDARLAQAAG
ncbi:siderophore-interacting protein [Gordonia sp. (in: high G+C Gram-positive bacteria)]|uniref:siderophore-interacting protein n=1 Tax=Gordonia sp. (in: high G+C Gram-positive bacteria) TaxID=84139 RepID=UPI0039E4B7DD